MNSGERERERERDRKALRTVRDLGSALFTRGRSTSPRRSLAPSSSRRRSQAPAPSIAIRDGDLAFTLIVIGAVLARSRSTLREIAPSIAISRSRRSQSREAARYFARSRSVRRRDHDRQRDRSPFARSRDRSFSLSFSLCASQFRKSFEVKIGTEMNFRGQSCFFTVKWKWFLENSIFKTNQTAYFTENDFLIPFSPKTNTP